MSEENVVELSQHDVTVESVITRLHRHRDRIKSITAIIKWDDGTADVVRSPHTAPEMAYDLLLLQKSALGMLDIVDPDPSTPNIV